MPRSDVTLSDGSRLSVRQLGLFELDEIPKDIPGPYTVTILFANGEVYEQEYDFSIVREKPGIPLEECEEKTSEWYAWREHLRYQEALLHPKKQFEAAAAYAERIKDHITSTCFDLLPPDAGLVRKATCGLMRFLTRWLPIRASSMITARDIQLQDWPLIHHAALCPQVSFEEVQAAVAVSFSGNVEGLAPA